MVIQQRNKYRKTSFVGRMRQKSRAYIAVAGFDDGFGGGHRNRAGIFS
jgi:hypothetical protein